VLAVKGVPQLAREEVLEVRTYIILLKSVSVLEARMIGSRVALNLTSLITRCGLICEPDEARVGMRVRMSGCLEAMYVQAGSETRLGIWFSWYNIPLALISLSWKGLAFDSPFLHCFLLAPSCLFRLSISTESYRSRERISTILAFSRFLPTN
jgi:hypothetical protein